MKLSYLFSKFRSLLRKQEKGAVVVEREQFAQEMREKFRGNTALLKAIEEGMNRKVKNLHMTPKVLYSSLYQDFARNYCVTAEYRLPHQNLNCGYPGNVTLKT